MTDSGSWKNRARREVEFVFSTMLMTLAMMTLAGCRTPEMQSRVKLDSASGIFDSADVTYRLDAGRMGEPIAVSRVQGQLVSYEDKATPPQAAASVGTLTVEYPHPEGIAGMARCRVVLETHKAGRPKSSTGTTAAIASAVSGSVDWMTSPWSKDTATYEAWVLDIPKIEFDRIVGGLNDQGYFSPVASKTKTTPGVEVTAKIDGRKLKREWKQVAELDALMLHVRQSGQLETYRRPTTTAKSQQASPTSSVAAYRAFLASENEAQQMIASRGEPTINVRAPEAPPQIAAVAPQPVAPPQVAQQWIAQPTARPQVAMTMPQAPAQPYVPPAAYVPSQPAYSSAAHRATDDASASRGWSAVHAAGVCAASCRATGSAAASGRGSAICPTAGLRPGASCSDCAARSARCAATGRGDITVSDDAALSEHAAVSASASCEVAISDDSAHCVATNARDVAVSDDATCRGAASGDDHAVPNDATRRSRAGGKIRAVSRGDARGSAASGSATSGGRIAVCDVSAQRALGSAASAGRAAAASADCAAVDAVATVTRETASGEAASKTNFDRAMARRDTVSDGRTPARRSRSSRCDRARRRALAPRCRSL